MGLHYTKWSLVAICVVAFLSTLIVFVAGWFVQIPVRVQHCDPQVVAYAYMRHGQVYVSVSARDKQHFSYAALLGDYSATSSIVVECTGDGIGQVLYGNTILRFSMP